MKVARIHSGYTIAAAVAALFSGTAGAAGFQLWEQNASGLGNAYAGSAAVAENASTIFFNPAAMTRLQAREFSVGVTAVRPSYKFSNDNSLAFAPPLAPGNVPLTGGSGGDAGDWGFPPNAYLSWALNKDLYLGVGFGAPFGLKTEYDSDWIGRFQSISFDIKTYNINPSIAYRLNETISIGAGANWQRMEAKYERMAAVVNAVTQNTRVKMDVDDESWGWNAGALFQVSPNTRIGLSYRSTIEHELEGDLTSNNQAVAPDVGARAKIKLPHTAILSVVQQVSDRWEMLGDVSRTGWKSVDTVKIIRTSGPASGTTAQELPADFQDTWRVAFGGIYKYNDAWKAKFGIAWDQTPVRDAERRLTSLPDENRIWFSVGGQWKPGPSSAVDFAFAYLHIKDPKIDNNQMANGRGWVKGTYDAEAYILGVQYSQSF